MTKRTSLAKQFIIQWCCSPHSNDAKLHFHFSFGLLLIVINHHHEINGQADQDGPSSWDQQPSRLRRAIIMRSTAKPIEMGHHHNNNNNGNFYSALPIKNFTAQGMYKNDTNDNNITQTQRHTHTHTHTHTHHHLKITCHQNTHAKRLKIKSLELHLHSLSPLSPSPYSLTHRCRSHAVLQEEK